MVEAVRPVDSIVRLVEQLHTEERIARLESLLRGSAHQVQREPLNELAA